MIEIDKSEQTTLQILLKELRTNSSLTQLYIAQKLNKPQSYVSKYENGEKTLNFLELRKLCKVFKININEFSELFEGKLK